MSEQQQSSKQGNTDSHQRRHESTSDPEQDFTGSHTTIPLKHSHTNPHTLTHGNIMQLQRTIGNQAVLRLLNSTQQSAGNVVVQRKFAGSLAGKTVSWVRSELEKNYTNVPNMGKITSLMLEGTEYTSIEQIADKLRLKLKTDAPPVTESETTTNVPDTGTTSSVAKPETTGNEPTTTDNTSDTSGGSVTTIKRGGRTGTFAATKGQKDWKDFGKLTLTDVRWTDSGLSIAAEVIGNPKHMYDIGDNVSVVLEPASKFAGMSLVASLKMYTNENMVTLDISYTYDELAKRVLPDKLTGTGEEKREKLAKVLPQIGVLAMWHPRGQTSGEQHRSGGISQKNGSGLINVISTIDETTLAKTEKNIRNIGWNEGEMMHEGRPVYDKFPNLLKLEHEMATTLEAESEYMASKEQFAHILKQMKSLETMDTDGLAHYGIEKLEGPFSKEFEDTYYDLDSGEGGFPLIANDIVLRRRHKKGEVGINLIALKGRTQYKEDDPNEAIRLASQIDAQYDFLDESKKEEIQNFLRTEGDNAFGRILRDALAARGREDILDTDFSIKHALTLKSTRTQYKMWLKNSTMIDFSADVAHGSAPNREDNPNDVVYSFEFGVGHPGLVATGSGSTDEVDTKELELQARIEELKSNEKNPRVAESQLDTYRQGEKQGLIHRPYHVPQDLEYSGLFEKGDYIQYQNLRNQIISELFALAPNALEKGGMKAKVLAKMMGLISDD